MAKLINWKDIFSILLFCLTLTQIIFPLKVNIYIANFFIYLLLSSFIIYFLFKKEKKIYFNLFIIIYFGFVFFSTFSVFWSIDYTYTLPLVLRIFLLGIVLLVIYNISVNYKNEKFLLYGILVGALFNELIAIGLITYTTPFTNPMRFTGTLARSNDVAIVMLISIITSFFILEDKNENKLIKILAYINLPLAIYTIFLTVSKKGIVFGTILIILYFFNSLKRYFFKTFLFIISMSAIVLFLFKDNLNLILDKFNRLIERFNEFEYAIKGQEQFGSTADRLMFIKEGIEFFSNNPIFGYGLNNFIVLEKTHHYAHNNYIELLVGVGLIGFILYYLLYIITFFEIMKIPNNFRIKKILIIAIIFYFLIDISVVSYSYKILVIFLFYIYMYTLNINKNKEYL